MTSAIWLMGRGPETVNDLPKTAVGKRLAFQPCHGAGHLPNWLHVCPIQWGNKAPPECWLWSRTPGSYFSSAVHLTCWEDSFPLLCLSVLLCKWGCQSCLPAGVEELLQELINSSYLLSFHKMSPTSPKFPSTVPYFWCLSQQSFSFLVSCQARAQSEG